MDKAGALASLEKLKESDAEFYEKSVKIAEKCYGSVTDESDPCETALFLATCEKQEAEKVSPKYIHSSVVYITN